MGVQQLPAHLQALLDTSFGANGVVLCVDDEPQVLRALARALRRIEPRPDILTAEGGAAGLALLAEHQVDIVLSDMRMPEMDGAAFLTAVREQWPATTRVLLTGYADFDSTMAALNAGGISLLLQKPWDDERLREVVVDAVEKRRLRVDQARMAAMVLEQKAQVERLNDALEMQVEDRERSLRETVALLEAANEELEQSWEATVEVLAGQVANRQRYPMDMVLARRNVAVAVGEALEMDDADSRELARASMLQGIGKVGLADAVLGQPREALAGAARDAYEQHPLLGEAVLLSVPHLRSAAALIRHQNERWDGTGYPDGLLRDAIPLSARILAVVGDYFALRRGALCRGELTGEAALQRVLEGVDSAYDPAVVQAFEQVLPTLDDVATDDELRVPPRLAAAGMVLARDLLSPDGLLLLKRGQRLDEKLVDRLAVLDDMGHAPPRMVVRRDTVANLEDME